MIDIKGLYEKGMPAEKLASKVLNLIFCDDIISYPIDPFEIINSFGIVYRFMEFENLEGIYVIPEDENDIPLIGINFNRSIQRQRFTAAHELCHHIKDRNTTQCFIDGQDNDVEKYAEEFASYLLMPQKELLKQALNYMTCCKVDLNGALNLSVYFGTSFEATVYALAYRINAYDGDKAPTEIKKAIQTFKPETKKKELGLDTENIILWEQIVNSYNFFWNSDYSCAWNVFKNDFIYHENRLEKLNLKDNVVAEIIAELRYKGKDSDYCAEECKEIIEVMGHSQMYDYIYNTTDSLNIYRIQNLHKMLYSFSPYPEAGGAFRQDNNYVTGSELETVDCSEVVSEIIALDSKMKLLVDEVENMSNSEFILSVIKIHHRLTVIHPFADGNGRCSRAILNWLFKVKGLPPVYIKYPEKDEYYNGLKMIDKEGKWDKLYKVFMKETIKSSIDLNKRVLDSVNTDN